MFCSKIWKVSVIVVGSVAFVAGGIFLGRSERDLKQSSGVAIAAVNNISSKGMYSLIPAYPGAIAYSLGNSMRVNGVPIDISYYYTKDPMEQVVKFYEREFDKTGHHCVTKNESAGVINVYTVDEDLEQQVNISIRRESGRTLVFPAVLPLTGKLVSGGQQVISDKSIPISDSAIGIMKVVSAQNDSENDQGDVLSYIEPKFDLDSAIGYIRDSLAKGGWNIEEYKPNFSGDSKSASMTFKKGTRSMTYLLSKSDFSGGVSVIVSKQVTID